MDSNSLVVLASVLGTLVAVGALSATAMVAAAYVHERARRIAAEGQARQLSDANAQLAAENKHLKFIRGNKLYSRALQDVDFAVQQSRIRLRVAKADLEEQLTVIEKLLDTGNGDVK